MQRKQRVEPECARLHPLDPSPLGTPPPQLCGGGKVIHQAQTATSTSPIRSTNAHPYPPHLL